MSKEERQADKAIKSAKNDLTDAKTWAEKPLPGARQKSRSWAKIAKRCKSKAERRKGKIISNDQAQQQD